MVESVRYKRERQSQRERETETERQTDRMKDTETDRQTDRQKQSHTDREIQGYNNYFIESSILPKDRKVKQS